MRRLAAATLLAAAPFGAQAQTLTAAMAAPVTSMDPHFYNAAPNNGIATHVFARLTERGADAKLEPSLAVSWKPVGETVWEFRLRPEARWHDGRPVTADDVVFSIARGANVPNSPGGFGGMVRTIKRSEAIDALTVHFHTAGPTPNLPIDMANFVIVSRHVGQGATTEEYNSGKAAVGAGPYKLARYASGDRIELVRNEDWWGKKPDWEKVTFRFIPNPGARVAALLAGDVDIIDVPPAGDLPRLKADPKLSVFSIQGLRLIYIGTSFLQDYAPAFTADNAGKPLGRNPFLDIKVRRALSLAINRAAISDRVMQGTAQPTGQWLPPGTFGYATSIKVPEFSPDKAKALLAEAGFPQGFRVTLHTPNDRYPNDAATAQAVAQMWTRIGVTTAVEALPWNTYAPRSAKHEFAAGIAGWGSNTAEAGYMLVNILGTQDKARGRGASNSRGYSSAALDTLTDQALGTLDDGQREKLLVQAVEMAIGDQALIPLHMLVNFWATKKSVVYDPRMDERTIAMNAHRAP